MYQQLATKLNEERDNLAVIEAKTGVTAQTMKNIINDPEAKRSRVTIIALENYFKRAKK
jgi:hypothetical protein